MTLAPFLLAVATLAGITAAQPAGAQQTISFGISSTESTQLLRQEWEPLLDAMEAQTGYAVQPFFAPDYAGIIEAMRAAALK